MVFKRSSWIGIINSILCSIAILVVIWSQLHLLNQLDHCSQNEQQMTQNEVAMDSTKEYDDKYDNNANINMYLSSLSSSSTFDPSDSTKPLQNCIVFLSDPNTINSTIGAIYNMREPSLGNWSQCIIVIGNDLRGRQFDEVFAFFKCLNVFHFDITDDALKNEMMHVHYWKTYIMLHPFFRHKDRFKYILYLDSDCITIRPIQGLIDRTLKYIKDKHSNRVNDIFVAWREDYRHQSMYKAVLDLKKYDKNTLEELKREYPDIVESKQGNVMLLDMLKLPSVEWFKSEMNRILNKYKAGFWRNDQSLFNLMFYHNSSDLGWSAFTHPPSEQLFYPPDNFPMVHTGGHEAMALRRPKEKRGGIERQPEKAWYHSLWEFWIFKLRTECPAL